jgi:hypothetical protein
MAPAVSTRGFERGLIRSGRTYRLVRGGFAVALALVSLVACTFYPRSDVTDPRKLPALLADPLLAMSVPGGVPESEAQGMSGNAAAGPSASSTQAFRNWTLSGQPIPVFLWVLRRVRVDGVRLQSVQCDVSGYEATGVKEILNQPASLVIGIADGELDINWSMDPGSTPQPLPSPEKLAIIGECPRTIARALG